MAFTRFCNKFCIPHCIYSDNDSTFLMGMGIWSNSHIDNDFSSYLVKNSDILEYLCMLPVWVVLGRE